MTELIVTSSVLVLVIAVLRYCLRGRISARLQYALWGLVALRLFLPFTLFESPVSVLNLLPETPVTVQSKMLTPTSPVQNAAEPTLMGDQPPILAESGVADGIAFGTLATVAWLGGVALCAIVILTANLHMGCKLRKSRVRLELPDCKPPVYTAVDLSSPCLYGLYTHSCYTNRKVAVSGTTLPSVVELYDADARADLLATFTLNEGKSSDTFTNLTSARNYYITAMGDRNAKLTVSDAS